MLRVIFATVLFASMTAHAQPYPSGQLPEGIAPTRYALDLTILADHDTFSGTVQINIALKQPTKQIWLHGRGLNVSSAVVVDSDGATIQGTWREIPDSSGVVDFTLEKTVHGPAAQIIITYVAPFNKQLEGLYRAHEAGEAYVFSQMEAISARVAFPSFDEPRFKTPYDISLTVRDSDAAISNTPAIKTAALQNGLKRVQFATTKPLPTYLIAVAVGPFDVVDWPPIPKSNVRDRDIPLRGITAKGKGPQIKYALENTAPLLLKLEDYFGIPYPFEKLDIIAALDFSAGAMENAGAIVYRELFLLFGDKPSLSQKRRYVNVHAHEIAHQWFGNLVTPAWWNDIWLNEAFATWMANKIAAAWDPRGEYDRASLRGALSAMSADSKMNARRIAEPIRSNDDIDNAFDGITYEKGGGVLSMFEQFFGVSGFQNGIRLYLTRHAFGSATADDFLKSVSEANQQAAGTEAFRSFLNQAGVPLVSTTLQCSRQDPRINIRQSRYFPAADGNTAAPQQTWKIPLCVSYGKGSQRGQTCSLVDGTTANVALSVERCPDWLMPNADGAGYYRFALDKKGWRALAAAADRLTDKEVLAAFDSLEAEFDAGTMNAGDYIDLLQALASRNNGLMTWDAASALSSDLVWIKEVLVSPKTQHKVQELITRLYQPLYDQLGIDPISPLDTSNPVQATLLRGPVISMVAVKGHLPAARAELAKRGAAYLGLSTDGKTGNARLHPEALQADIVEHALAIAVQDIGPPVVNAIIELLEGERDSLVRARMISALNRSTDPTLAERVRALALSGSLRVNEVPMIVYGSMGERANRATAWEWFKSNFNEIKSRMPTFNQGGLAAMGEGFCSPAEREDYKKFFATKVNQLTGAPRVMASALETINHCIALVEKQRIKADAYFAEP